MGTQRQCFSSCAWALSDNVMATNARSSNFFISSKCYVMFAKVLKIW